MNGYLAKPFTREALHGALARWLPGAAAAGEGVGADPAAELLLDRATLDALRALPPRGSQDMLSHIARSWLSDSQRLVAAIERALNSGEAMELARAAHAWRSCNGHVGALGLMRLCRELEACGRTGDLSAAAGLWAQVRVLYPRVSEELLGEMRRSA
jgi:hypothetical protein